MDSNDKLGDNGQYHITPEEAAARYLEHQETLRGKFENLRQNGPGRTSIVAMAVTAFVVFIAIIGQCSRSNDSATDDRDEDRVSARSVSVTTSQTSEDIGADSKRTNVRVRLNDRLREAKRKESEAQRKFNRADAAIETAFERLISTDENTVQRDESLRELNEAESQQDAASRELMEARSLVCEAYIDIAGSDAFSLEERRDAVRQGTRPCTESSQHARLRIN